MSDSVNRDQAEGEESFCDLCGLSAEVLKIALPQPPVSHWQEYSICKECADTIFQAWCERLDEKWERATGPNSL